MQCLFLNLPVLVVHINSNNFQSISGHIHMGAIEGKGPMDENEHECFGTIQREPAHPDDFVLFMISTIMCGQMLGFTISDDVFVDYFNRC